MRCERRTQMLQGSLKSGRGASLTTTLGRPPWPWPELRSPADPTGFTLMTSPRTSVTLSFLALSTLPAAMVQARENYGQVAILRTQAGLTYCPVSSSFLLSPEPLERITGRWYLEILRSATCREWLLGSSLTAPFLSPVFGFMAWTEGGRGSRLMRVGAWGV